MTDGERQASVDDILDRVRAYIRFRDWSLWQLHKESGLGWSTLRFIHQPYWAPKSATLRVLAAMIPDDFDPTTAPSVEEWQRRFKRARVRPLPTESMNDGPAKEDAA